MVIGAIMKDVSVKDEHQNPKVNITIRSIVVPGNGTWAGELRSYLAHMHVIYLEFSPDREPNFQASTTRLSVKCQLNENRNVCMHVLVWWYL